MYLGELKKEKVNVSQEIIKMLGGRFTGKKAPDRVRGTKRHIDTSKKLSNGKL